MRIFEKGVFCKLAVLMAFLVLISSLPLANAEDLNETAKINLARTWLMNRVSAAWPSSVEENVFALLALADDSSYSYNGLQALYAKSRDNNCWPSGTCDVKSTAMALLALNSFQQDTAGIESWLLSRKKLYTEKVSWYIQIDSSEATQCNITYGNKKYGINMLPNKKIATSGLGSCLLLAQNGYLLRITGSSGCFNATYSIRCGKEFLVSTMYSKSSTEFFVSSQTSSGVSGDTINVKINSYCLGTGSCDYLGTLWAAYALQKAGRSEYSMLLPYLSSESDLNEKYMPDAFLYSLTLAGEYADKITNMQTLEGSWTIPGSPYNKFHDTALAFLMLSSFAESENTSSARNFLLSSQSVDGSWQSSVRDTAFIFYSLFKPISLTNYTPYENQTQQEATECSLNSGVCRDSCYDNEKEATYNCTGTQTCCKLKTCAELNGEPCATDQICENGEGKISEEGLCCVGGTCVDQVKSCSDLDGTLCELNEKCAGGSFVYSEEGSNRCCINGECKKPGSIWIWIILILIVLAALGYWKRDVLKNIFMKKPPRPGMPPARPGYPLRYQPAGPSQTPRIQPRYPQMPLRPAARFPMPPARPPQKLNVPKPSAKKTAEEELQETIKRLKKLTK